KDLVKLGSILAALKYIDPHFKLDTCISERGLNEIKDLLFHPGLHHFSPDELLELIKRFIDCGLDLSCLRHDKTKETVLMAMARSGQFEICEYLVTSVPGIDLNAVDRDGTTALGYAADTSIFVNVEGERLERLLGLIELLLDR